MRKNKKQTVNQGKERKHTMNNGNAAKKINNVAADDSWSGIREVDGKVAERDAALGQGNQIEAVADAQKQATISSVGETATAALSTEQHDKIPPVARYQASSSTDRTLYRASDGTTYSSREQVIDYERGLRD